MFLQNTVNCNKTRKIQGKTFQNNYINNIKKAKKHINNLWKMHKIKTVLKTIIVEMHKKQWYNNISFSSYEGLDEY